MNEADIRALKDSVDIVEIVSRYTPLKKRGVEFYGPCPIHKGDGDNFSVNPSKRIWACWSHGCHEDRTDGRGGNDVIAFLMKVEGIGFPEATQKLGAPSDRKPFVIRQAAPANTDEWVSMKPPVDCGRPDFTFGGKKTPTHTFEYKDTDGLTLGFVCRYPPIKDKKDFSPWSWGSAYGGPGKWAAKSFNKPRPLYGLDRLAARPDDPVMVVEGEKAADAAAALLPPYVCISWPGGAQAWKHVDWALLRGRRVDFWPDNDQPGRDAMAGIIALVSDPRGLNCYGKTIDPAGMPDGFDAADWTDELGDVTQWASQRVRWYREQNPAPQAAQAARPAADSGGSSLPPPPEAVQTPEDAGPVTEFPPLEAYADEAKAKKPARKKRHLHAVSGNNALAPDADAEPMPAAMSEDALAEHFVLTHGEHWRYCTEWNLWLQWKGDGWHRDRRNEVSDVCKTITRQALEWPEAAALPPSSRQKINSKRTAWNARDLAAADRRISILAEQLDADTMLLGVPGGVVDLRNGKLLDAEPEQYVTRRCAVAPRAGDHPLFDRVLERACAGHDGMRDYLLRWFGYMLTGKVTEEAFMFLHGPGGSGKSTLIKAITEIMGDYATTISMDALTETKHQRHSQEIAKLEGARLVYASETEEGRRFNESLIKWLTGGDKIVAHRMRMDDREFKPTFKILIFGNSVPHLKSVGEEMKRRIHLVEYAGSLSETERDHTLKERLVAEYPAILATLVRGCVDWQDCGLGKPESVSDSVDQYLEDEDTLGAFLDDSIERKTGARELSGDVYRRYKAWATNAGEYVMSQKRLVQALHARGFEQKRSNGLRYLLGFKLKESAFQDPTPYYGPD